MFKFPKIDCERTSNIIQNFIKIRLAESSLNGYVIGLSGGIDSSLSASLLTKAVGSNNVHAYFIPTTTTPKADKGHILELCKNLDLKLHEIDLQSIIENYSLVVKQPIDSKTPEWSNLKARLRMVILYYYANQLGCLVCGNGNKSEIMIGYYTKFGDSAADILPIGDLYKQHVVELAKYLKLPKAIVTKAPSAGLWDGQTDENEIGMSYDTLDNILYLMETLHKPHEIAKILEVPMEQINKVKKMIYKSEHKRRGAILLKLGVRTPLQDWRIPLDTPSKYNK